jgi:chaperonin cofactor prefoldin
MMKKIILPTALLIIFTGSAFSSPSASAENTRKKLSEWLQLQKTISAEAADWKAEKQRLSDLNAIRLKEISKLDEWLAHSESARAVQTEKQEELNHAVTTLEAQRTQLGSSIAALEKQLIPLLTQLPPPLQKKRAPEIARIQQEEPEDTLQDRYRDLLLLLTEIAEFNQTITLDQYMLERDGQRTEVDVLYLGLSQAWYINRNGTDAGYALPASKGWNWISAPSSASAIRHAMQIAEKQIAPDFAALPLLPSETE